MCNLCNIITSSNIRKSSSCPPLPPSPLSILFFEKWGFHFDHCHEGAVSLFVTNVEDAAYSCYVFEFCAVNDKSINMGLGSKFIICIYQSMETLMWMPMLKWMAHLIPTGHFAYVLEFFKLNSENWNLLFNRWFHFINCSRVRLLCCSCHTNMLDHPFILNWPPYLMHAQLLLHSKLALE